MIFLCSLGLHTGGSFFLWHVMFYLNILVVYDLKFAYDKSRWNLDSDVVLDLKLNVVCQT